MVAWTVKYPAAAMLENRYEFLPSDRTSPDRRIIICALVAMRRPREKLAIFL
jgi:hypothetical protein